MDNNIDSNTKYVSPTSDTSHYLIPGPQGDRGLMGYPGRDGRDGKHGRDGEDGANGLNGNDGIEGPPGERGIDGEKGEKGEIGINGVKGDKGEMGACGTFNGKINQDLIPDSNGEYSIGNKDYWYSDIWAREGHFSSGSISIGNMKLSTQEVNGESALILPKNIILGVPGIDDIDGSIGPKGDKGLIGRKGERGRDGLRGGVGPEGPPGEQGIQGSIGVRGVKGEKGEIGEVGEDGETGEKGDKGETGDIGPEGIQGIAETFIVFENNGSYRINGQDNNPILHLLKGQRYKFRILASDHPFWIQSLPGEYNENYVYTTQVINNGSSSGYMEIKISDEAPPKLYYVSQNNSSMNGIITIKTLTGNALKGEKGEIGDTSILISDTPSDISVFSSNKTNALYYEKSIVDKKILSVTPSGRDLSFLNIIGTEFKYAVDRTSLLLLLDDSYGINNKMFNGILSQESMGEGLPTTDNKWKSKALTFKFKDDIPRAINEFTIWISAQYQNNETGILKSVLKIYGSNDATASDTGTWFDLNSHTNSGSNWLQEAISTKTLIGPVGLSPQAWVFRLSSNINNYKYYKLINTVVSFLGEVFDVTFDYKKIYEIDYI